MSRKARALRQPRHDKKTGAVLATQAPAKLSSIALQLLFVHSVLSMFGGILLRGAAGLAAFAAVLSAAPLNWETHPGYRSAAGSPAAAGKTGVTPPPRFPRRARQNRVHALELRANGHRLQ